LAFFWILFTLSSVGLPGLNGFPSEFLTILGAFKSKHLGFVYGTVAAVGMVLGAVYMLHMAACVIWGPLKTPEVETEDHDHEENPLPRDLSGWEIGILVPLALAVVVIGVIPGKMLDTFREPVIQLIGNVNAAASQQTVAPDTPVIAAKER